VARLPIDLAGDLGDRLARAIDPEGKIVRALEALGPVSNRDVVLIDGGDGPIQRGIEATGARLVRASGGSPLQLDLADASADAMVALWSSFRGADPADVAEADRVLRPDGRLLVVHDYGRDGISTLRGDLPEYGLWSRPGGPFLRGGFRIRVVHCFWTFDSLETTTAFLAEAFGRPGSNLAATLTRPRLTYKVAIYHRTRGAPGRG
jgi:hypothetical protein